MIKKLSGLVNKCYLSLKDGTDKPKCKKTFEKLRMVQNWLKNDKNLFKGIQFMTKKLCKAE